MKYMSVFLRCDSVTEFLFLFVSVLILIDSLFLILCWNKKLIFAAVIIIKRKYCSAVEKRNNGTNFLVKQATVSSITNIINVV